MTDILTPSDCAKLSEKIAAFRLPWCVPWLASGIRHLMRNCDLDCFEAGHERGAGCERPGMYDGQTIAEVMNAAPRMLATIAELRDIAPEVHDFGDHWIAEIDYLAQGNSEEEARRNWFDGWRRTVELRRTEGWYTPEGHVRNAEAFDKRFNRDLQVSRRVTEVLNRFGGLPHPHTTDDQYERLCELLEQSAGTIAAHEATIASLREGAKIAEQFIVWARDVATGDDGDWYDIRERAEATIAELRKELEGRP